jgi:hypothetical protein
VACVVRRGDGGGIGGRREIVLSVVWARIARSARNVWSDVGVSASGSSVTFVPGRWSKMPAS